VATSNSQPSKAVTFDVFKSGTARIDTTVDAVKKDVDSQIQKTSGQFQVLSVRDVGESIEKQFHDLQRDFILTISLVTLILFIFLGVRQAFVSALAAPLTFFITFVVMNLTGISLSFISIFSLLLSLGLLVDDTIVVVSAMTAYYRSGKFTPLQTGLLVFRDFLAPVLTTTVTTVWAFLPLLLASGIIGEFIKPIPIVVSATLIASIFVALFITLPIIIFLLKPELPLRVIIFLRLILLVIILAVFYTFIPKTNILLLEILAFLIFLFVTFQIRTYLDGRTFNSITRSKRTASFIRKFRSYLDQGIISFQKLSSTYKKVITRILRSSSARKKAILMVIIFSIFSYLLLPLGFIQSEFFPKTNADFLFVSIELPAGTNLSITNQEAKRLLEEIKKTPDVKFVTADVGKSFSNTQGISQGDTNTILLSLELFKEGSRQRTSFEIADILRQKFASYQKGKISVQELSSGPPAGADLQIKLFGPDLKVLDQYANRIEDYLSKQPGVTNVDKTIKPGTSKLVFIPNKQKLSEIGLTQDQIGFWLRLYASGFTADKIKLDNDNNQKKDINIRLNSQPETVENISEIYLPTPAGILPITSLGDIKLEPNPTLITRENGKRTISVTASVLKGYQPTALNKSLEEFANSLNLPSDYSWQTGGLNEENQNSVNSILQAMALSFLLIIVTMVLQFGSFRKALIVMLVIPLSVSGVFIIFALTQTPLSFPALIGVLALFGIVVKNSILLVDKIIANIHTGMEFTEAISDAAASRLEAISLTSLATIFGLIPITFSSPLWRGLGGAIIAGLTFSGTIMLFFIPVVYYLIFKGSEGVKSAKKAKS
jgi:multidrug efflux pump subunit AcrB